MSQGSEEEELLRSQRKKAAQLGTLFGAIVLILGAIVCLIYALIYKPWQIPESHPHSNVTTPQSQ